MKRYTQYYIFILLILTPFFSKAQVIKEISDSPQDFPKELERMVKSINIRDERKKAEEFAIDFKLFWNSDTLKPEQKKTVIKTINHLLKKRHQINPTVLNYLRNTHILFRQDKPDKKFKVLDDGLSYYIERLPRSELQKVLENLNNFINNKILISHRGTKWQSVSHEYKFVFDEDNKDFRIKLPKTDLIAYSHEDSSMIYNTSGYYNVEHHRWHGKGGIVTWENAGLDPDKVYANLNDYEIDMRFTKYTIENVNFFNKKYFSEPLIGRLSNRTESGVSRNRVKNPRYPRFVSSEGQKVIKDIFPSIDYTGGFSMLGNKLVASSSDAADASIIINKDDKPFIKLKAKDFGIDSSRIVSRRASLTMYLEEDSIYHPAIRITYEDDKKMLSINRDEEGLSRSPFYDTYHMIDIDVEAILYKLGNEKIRFQNLPSASGRNSAFFRSQNFYDKKEFEQIKGMDKKNPLYYIQDFHNTTGKKHFHLDDIVQFVDYAPHMVKAMILRIANMGFLSYNPDNDMITIRERLFNYLKARRGLIDYDVIRFNSRTNAQSNAELSLLDNNMKLFGVRMIQLSDSQNVVIDPKQNTLTLKKNRDFDFNGKVKAGRFVIHGNDFEFSYKNFKINMPLVDSLEFWVKPFEEHEDKYSERKYVESVIEDMEGDLLIDKPDNKSGRKPSPRFPILNSESNAYVYYDKNCKYPNIYDRNEFYYRIDPFSIDSLDNFETEGLEFDGYLASGGIFPVIEYPLSVQKDYSLGFIYQTPKEGYTAYGGKGHYNDQIMLSNKGLEGNGTLEYLTSTAKSREFDFFPDSTNAIAYEYDVEAQEGQVEYPSVQGSTVELHWEPYNDFMTIRNQEEPMNMFNQQAHIDGEIKYTPDFMRGNGSMQIEEAEISSELFRYDNQNVNADTCNFTLHTKESEFGLGSGDKVEQDLITNNFKAEISFADRKGEFTSNSGSSRIEFPINQYISFIDQFTWYMDEEEVAFSSKVSDEMSKKYDDKSMEEMADIDLEGARFVSIHPGQDSLEFTAENAVYSRNKQTIDAKGVRMIRVADAAIFPDEQNIIVQKRAEIDELQNAKILANTTTKYHTIQDAVVNIEGRYEYFGRGNYNYVDKNDETQKIYLNNISVDSTSMTNAKGEIKEDDNFTLSPAFNFKGNVKLVSTEEYLTFDGGFQIRNHCDTLPKEWVQFTSVIQPDDIKLPVDSNMQTTSGRDTYASILHAKDNKQIYSSFFVDDNTRSLRRGNSIFSSTGVLIFDEVSSEYRIAPEEKLKQPTLPGNYTAYNTRDCIHNGQGAINFFKETGQVDLQTFGEINQYIHEDSTEIKGVISLDFLFSEDALELMAEDINSNKDLKGVDLNTERFKQALMEMLGREQANEIISELTIQNRIKKMPDAMKRTMTLTDVKLHWDEKSESFISTQPVGIAFLGEEQVSKYVDAYIVFNKGRRGGFSEGEFSILLEVSSAEWYYFNYKPTGVLTVVAGSDEFKSIINDLDSKDRKMDTPTGEKSFRYNLGSSRQREQFLRNIRRITED
ncbi:MAG: hypothetical protein ACQESM_04690 [Bacteroidota bacterium]